MADRFQNGLLLTAITGAQGGRTFQRWLVEFATQICGWTLTDQDTGTRYNNTKGTGVNANSVAGQPQQLDITRDAYNFAVGVDEGRYLTVTGMPAGFEDRNGIYRIGEVVSAKIVNLEIRFSVHDAGIPHPSGAMTWRLWSNDASDVPAYAGTDYAVIQGTGNQGGAYNFDVRISVRKRRKHSISGFALARTGPPVEDFYLLFFWFRLRGDKYFLDHFLDHGLAFDLDDLRDHDSLDHFFNNCFWCRLGAGRQDQTQHH